MSFSISSSALKVSQTYMDASAHNIANMNTKEFKPQHVKSADVAFNNEGAGAAVTSVEHDMTSKHETEKDLTNLKQQEHIYKANAKVLECQNKVLGSLLETEA